MGPILNDTYVKNIFFVTFILKHHCNFTFPMNKLYRGRNVSTNNNSISNAAFLSATKLLLNI